MGLPGGRAGVALGRVGVVNLLKGWCLIPGEGGAGQVLNPRGGGVIAQGGGGA